MSFEAQNQQAYALFNRCRYTIPRNQRRYVWSKRNWQELFEDIMLVVNGHEQNHFIGSVVLYKEKDRENGISYYTIVDGQQRITTLTILLSSIAFWLKCSEAENEFNGTKQYILARDDSNLDHVVISAENYASLERIIRNIVSTPLEILKEKTPESFVDDNTIGTKDKNSICAAFKYYLNEIRQGLKSTRKKPVNYLTGLRDAIVNKILYVSIIATSEEDACTVFEVLNARGSVLEDHELLKNYIMKGIESDGVVDQAKAIWGDIETDLGSNIGRFVKHYATHRYRVNAQDGISDYKLIQQANKGKNTLELLYDLRAKATSYCKLISPNCIGETANCSETEYAVYSFLKKHKQEQIRPVLLSLIHQNQMGKISTDIYESTILFLQDFFVCYNIIGQENSNKITNIIYSLSRELEINFSNQLLQQLISSLSGKLPRKESFKSAFALVGWSHHGGLYEDEKDKERTQIILEALERYKNAGKTCDEFTIEHILDEKDNATNATIGNLIPLEESLNQQCNGKSFEQKLELYEKSSFQTARNIAARYKGSGIIFDASKRADIMAEEFYSKVLNFKINDVTGCIETSRLTKANKRATIVKETIGETIAVATGKQVEKKQTFEQLRLF